MKIKTAFELEVKDEQNRRLTAILTVTHPGDVQVRLGRLRVKAGWVPLERLGRWDAAGYWESRLPADLFDYLEATRKPSTDEWEAGLWDAVVDEPVYLED